MTLSYSIPRECSYDTLKQVQEKGRCVLSECRFKTLPDTNMGVLHGFYVSEEMAAAYPGLYLGKKVTSIPFIIMSIDDLHALG